VIGLAAAVARCLLLVAGLLAASLAAALELHFVDVGQGDAVLILAPDGRAVVYDAGPSNDAMLHYLRQVGVEEVVLAVASHAHADHIGGLPAVLEAFRPPFLLDNDVPHTTRAFERYLDAAERSGAQLLAPERRTIRVGEVALHVIPPPGRPGWGHNDNSVGLIIEYGEFRASLTGDAEPRLFDWWLTSVPDMFAPVHVHKASHHGSRNGDTAAALARLAPEVIVVSAGAGNRYGHPHAEALERYAAVGARVYRTDLHGHVEVHAAADGSFEVRTQRSADASDGASPEPSPTAPTPALPAPAGCVDVNAASLERLQDIVHIGPERARAIVELRPLASLEDLTRVSGIGPARLADIIEQGLACVP